MITTLTILDGKRAAQASDYPKAIIFPDGHIERGPTRIGGVHLVVEFDVVDELREGVVIRSILDMDTQQPPRFMGDAAKIADVIATYCRQFAGRLAMTGDAP